VLYSIFKDFAGPIATIFASISALVVTAYFGWRQWQTAEKQWQTAEEKVHLDLFDRRYAVYEELCAIVSQYTTEGVDQSNLFEFERAAVRARFLFGPEVTSVLDATGKALSQEIVLWSGSTKDLETEAGRAKIVDRRNFLNSFFKTFDELVSSYMRHHQKGP
jgi:hypothetical protein